MAGKILRGPAIKKEFEESCLGQFLFTLADKHGDKICQIDAVTGKKETFNSVKLRSTRVALRMKKEGIVPRDVILTCSRNSLDSSIPVLAAAFLGAIAGNLDPNIPIIHMNHLISLVKPKMIFVEDNSLPSIEHCLENQDKKKLKIIVFGKSHRYISFDNFLNSSEEDDEFKPILVDPQETAMIFFSSGTTGLPKAICLNHSYFLEIPAALPNIVSDALLHFSTLYWISGIMMLMLSFARGGYRVLMPEFDAETTFQVIEKYKISFVVTAPGLTYPLVNLRGKENYDTSSVHVFCVVGSKTSPSQVGKLRELFGSTKVLLGYGMTETGTVTVFDVLEHKHLITSKSTSCGKAVPGNTIKVVDPETNQILGPNQHGEIRVKNDHLMLGYYSLDSSDECFDDDGFLKTGDIGYYDEDECFYVVDRIKEMFKYQSWHIMPSIIEGVLLEHPHVKEAVVFGIPHEEYGDIPAASVVLKKNDRTTSAEIAEFVAKRVSNQEKLRGGVFIVDDIPKTPTGKVARKEAKNHMIKMLETLPVNS